MARWCDIKVTHHIAKRSVRKITPNCTGLVSTTFCTVQEKGGLIPPGVGLFFSYSAILPNTKISNMKTQIIVAFGLLLSLTSAFGQPKSTQKNSNGDPPPVDTIHSIGRFVTDSGLTLTGNALTYRLQDLEFYKDSHSFIVLVDSSREVISSDTFIYKGYADLSVRNQEYMRHLLNRSVQFFIVVFTIILLIIIWMYYVVNLEPIIKEDNMNEDGRDYGLLLLALAMLFWALQSLVSLLDLECESLLFFLSTLNNAFLLASFPFFEHGFVQKRSQRRYWEIIVIVASAVTFILSLIFYSNDYKGFAYFLDATFSVFTFCLLAYNLEKTFRARRMPVLSRLSWVIMLLAITGQLIIFGRDVYPKEPFDVYFGNVVWDNIVYIVSQASLCSILIALAFSWINEKTTEVSLSRSYQIVQVFQLNNIDFSDRKKALEKVKDFIGENRITLAIQTLQELCRNWRGQEEAYKAINLGSAEFRNAEEKFVMGLIRIDEYTIARNKVIASLLLWTENLEKTLKSESRK